jgi:MotA/TolQ/ExbB proton channel family
MQSSIWSSLGNLDASGAVVLTAIGLAVISGVLTTLALRTRYALLAGEVRRAEQGEAVEGALLSAIVRKVQAAVSRGVSEVNVQAIIDECMHRRVRWLLLGERYVKALTGLVIILGLVGTFYGLSSSIGRLTALLSSSSSDISELTSALTSGLSQTLQGMSVAFLCSLAGIVSAVILTLVGVFLSVPESRLALSVQIESYVDHAVIPALLGPQGAPLAGAAALASDARIERAVSSFGASVQQLAQVVQQFEGALGTLATNTRDFQQFNAHLRDNIQRMSLSFGDLSTTLEQKLGALRGPGQR